MHSRYLDLIIREETVRADVLEAPLAPRIACCPRVDPVDAQVLRDAVVRAVGAPIPARQHICTPHCRHHGAHTAACRHGPSPAGSLWRAASVGDSEAVATCLARGASTDEADEVCGVWVGGSSGGRGARRARGACVRTCSYPTTTWCYCCRRTAGLHSSRLSRRATLPSYGSSSRLAPTSMLLRRSVHGWAGGVAGQGLAG